MRKLVRVTRRDIREAIERLKNDEYHSECCPVALASQRALRRPDLKVGSDAIRFPKEDRKLELPRKAAAFIDRFDEEKPVKPFSFYINWPAELGGK